MAHLEEMQRYIRLTEADELPDFDEVVDDVTSVLELDQNHELIESLSDVIFKLQNYRELGGSGEYMLGVEEGLALAATMLTRLVENHTGRVL